MDGRFCRLRVLILAASILFATPVVSLAGSATSRWDARLGGMVKFDYGYATQAVGADADFAQRKSRLGAENALDETSNQFWAAGETRLNILIKGPTAKGAKTSAFVEGDFRGQYSDSTYGNFNLRHAYMKLDWPKTSVVIGQTWQPWGIFPNLWLLKYDEDGPYNRGIRIPQITVNQKLSRDFSIKGGITSPSTALGSEQGSNIVSSNTTSNWPDFAGELVWATDRYGRIGPWPFELAAGGLIGSRKVIYDRATGIVVPDQELFNPGGVPGGSFGNKSVTAWAVSLRGFVPIIPERGIGKRANALGLVFAAFTGQYITNYATLGTGIYNRDAAGRPVFIGPVVTGGWAQLMYYITDKLSISGHASYSVSNMSVPLRRAQPNAVFKAERYAANVVYDLNAAIRFGIEGSYVYTRYSAPFNGLADWGSFYSARFAAYYFF